MFQQNTDFLINQLKNYFYKRHLTLLLNSNKKVVLSIAQGFRNIHFLTYFYYFAQWIRCAMFQINTDVFIFCVTVKK